MKNRKKLLEAIVALLEQADDRVLIVIYYMLIPQKKR